MTQLHSEVLSATFPELHRYVDRAGASLWLRRVA